MSDKKCVTEEMRPQDEWFNRARKEIKTPEQLKEFAIELFENTEHDYGTVCHAVSAIALAGAWLGAHIQGITGFQAGFVMWDFLRKWQFSDNKTGLKIVDYDKLLFPQYEYKFDKTITEDVWKSLQKEAFNSLQKDPDNKWSKNGYEGCWTVREHWGNICRGIVPFGFKVVKSSHDETEVIPEAYPDFKEEMVFPQEVLDDAWKDSDSPYFDKERYDLYMKDWLEKCDGACGN